MDAEHVIDEDDICATDDGNGALAVGAHDDGPKGRGTGFMSVHELVGLGKSMCEFYVRAIFDTPPSSRATLVQAVGDMDAEPKVRTLSLLKSLSDEQKIDLVTILIKLGTGEHCSALTQAVVGMGDDEVMLMVDELLDLSHHHRLVLIDAIGALDVAAKPAFIEAVLIGVELSKKALVMTAVDGMNPSERGQMIGAMGDMEDTDKRTLMEAFSDGVNKPMDGDNMRDLIAIIAAMQADEKRLLVQSLTEIGQAYRSGVVQSMIGTADTEKMTVLSLLAYFQQSAALPSEQPTGGDGEGGDGEEGGDVEGGADAEAAGNADNAEAGEDGKKPNKKDKRKASKKDKKKSVSKSKPGRFSIAGMIGKKEAKVVVEEESARDLFCALFVKAMYGGLLNTERGEIIRILKQLHALDVGGAWDKQPDPVSITVKALTADGESENKEDESKEDEGAGEGDSLLADGEEQPPTGDQPSTSGSAGSQSNTPISAKSGGRPKSRGFGFSRKKEAEPWVDPQETQLVKDCMRSLLTLMSTMGEHTSLRLRLCNTVAYFVPPQKPAPSAGVATSMEDDGGASVVAAVTEACGPHARSLADLVPLFMTVAQRLLLLHGGHSSHAALEMLDLLLRSLLPLLTVATGDIDITTAITATGGIPAPSGSEPIWQASGRQPDRRADLRFGSLDGFGSAAGRSAGVVSETQWVRIRVLLLALEGILKAQDPAMSASTPLAGGSGGDGDPHSTAARRDRLAKAKAFMMARLEPHRRRQPNVIENDDLRPPRSSATAKLPMGLALGDLPEVDPGGRAASAR
jgi:hypothetical protein